MATNIEPLTYAQAFAPIPSFPRDNASCSDSAVFAGRERKSNATLPSRCRGVVIRLEIGDRQVCTLTYSGERPPDWAWPVLRSLETRWGVDPGWDGYTSKPTQVEYVEQLLNCLSSLLQNNSPAPDVIPLSDGGMQAEWHLKGTDLEIVVAADAPPRYYLFNHADGEEEEGDLNSNFSRVQDLVAGIR